MGLSEHVISEMLGTGLRGGVDLLFTSPPFPLIREKSYGNHEQHAYVRWLAGYADLFADLLSETGSLVIEIGNAWNKGLPTMSTVPMEALLELSRAGKFHLCQEIIWHNTARLPSPAQWVTVERIRLKDSFSRIWWLSRTPRPLADNRRVLQPYSKSMLQLLKRQSYNSGKRPSEHVLGASGFLANRGGAISASVREEPQQDNQAVPGSVLSLANTGHARALAEYCARHGLKNHPARMPEALVKFFVEFLTEPNDLVMDPFAGTNTTGAVAEAAGRRWLSIEADAQYARSGQGRFMPNNGR